MGNNNSSESGVWCENLTTTCWSKKKQPTITYGKPTVAMSETYIFANIFSVYTDKSMAQQLLHLQWTTYTLFGRSQGKLTY